MELDKINSSYAQQLSIAAERVKKQTQRTSTPLINPPKHINSSFKGISGVYMSDLNAGDKLFIGSEVVLEVTCVNNPCHHLCAVCRKTKNQLMPNEINFLRVLKGGTVRAGDMIIRIQPNEEIHIKEHS